MICTSLSAVESGVLAELISKLLIFCRRTVQLGIIKVLHLPTDALFINSRKL
jgi:hypothetical protein